LICLKVCAAVDDMNDDMKPFHPMDQLMGSMFDDPFANEPFFNSSMHQQRRSARQGSQSSGGLMANFMRHHTALMQQPMVRPDFGNSGTSMSFQSFSSFTSGSAGQPVRVTRTRSHQQSGGVSQSQESFSDSRTKEEHMRVTRGLQNQRRSITKSRYQGGREEMVDNTYNMDKGQMRDFDARWRSAAAQAPHIGRLSGRPAHGSSCAPRRLHGREQHAVHQEPPLDQTRREPARSGERYMRHSHNTGRRSGRSLPRLRDGSA